MNREERGALEQLRQHYRRVAEEAHAHLDSAEHTTNASALLDLIRQADAKISEIDTLVARAEVCAAAD